LFTAMGSALIYFSATARDNPTARFAFLHGMRTVTRGQGCTFLM
jgi:hypothetical protein